MTKNGKLLMKNLINQTRKELMDQHELLKKELFNLRFQRMNSEVKRVNKFSQTRKNIARIKTELTRKSKAGEKNV